MDDIQLREVKYRGDDPEVGNVYENAAYKSSDIDLEKGGQSTQQYNDETYEQAVHYDSPPPKTSTSGKYNVTDEESDEEDRNKCDQFIKHAQDGCSSGWNKHRNIIKWVILAVLLCLYAAYFIYAMFFERLTNEPSIRLCWVTCVVVFFILLNVLWKYCGDRLKKSCKPCTAKLARNEKLISWIIVTALFLALLVFVFVDIFTYTKQPYNLVSGSGIIIYVLLFFIFSVSPAQIQWRAVAWGLGLQFLFAVIILRWSGGYQAFLWLGDRISAFILFSDVGAIFMFGESYTVHFFAFKVLPTIIFFSTVISMLYHLGVMQVVVKYVAIVMQFAMGTTAGESLNAAGNIFVGQTEAPLLIRPLLPHMTHSELHAVMTGGFATVAGGVLAAYISFGVPANHLLSASVMSAPAALAMAKLLYPETEKTQTTAKMVANLPKSQEVNLIAAASKGASDSIALVANVAVNLIAFIALLAFFDVTLSWFGSRVGIDDPPLTFRLICSYLLWPLALIMGVEVSDCRQVAKLIGVKTFLNEFVAYIDLGKLIKNRELLNNHTNFGGNWTYAYHSDDIVLEPFPGFNQTNTLENGIISLRSEVISTYALCGFANIGSIGIQLGGLSAMAPQRRRHLAKVAVRAMIAGNVACFMTACIAGLFFTGEDF